MSGNICQVEILNKKKSGDLFWCSVIIAPLQSDDKIPNFIVIYEDITEKKKNIEELIAAREKAEEVDELKTQFFAYLSHELRTPFLGLLGYAEMIKE